jgi:hypothetical protein
MMVTIGHHCSGRCCRYSSKSDTSPGCLGRVSWIKIGYQTRRDVPHQAEGLNTDLQNPVGRQSSREATIGIEEGVWHIEVPFFSCEISMDASTKGLDVDIRTVEATLLKDVGIGMYFHVVGCVFPTRVVCDGVDEVAQVEGIREGRLKRHAARRLRENSWKRATSRGRCGTACYKERGSNMFGKGTLVVYLEHVTNVTLGE